MGEMGGKSGDGEKKELKNYSKVRDKGSECEAGQGLN